MDKGEGAEVDQYVVEAEEEGLWGGSSCTGSHRYPSSGCGAIQNNAH